MAIARPLRACLLLVLLMLGAPGIARAAETDLAMAVKATYLYKFAPFVEWPDQAAEFPGNVFAVCVAGQSGFDDLLARAMAGQSVGGHPVVLRVLSTITGPSGCSVLFVLGSPAQPEPAMLAAVSGLPVLTVTDEAFSPGVKGMINFVVRDNRVRFEIDQVAMAAARLSASSKLLSLAVSVRLPPSQ